MTCLFKINIKHAGNSGLRDFFLCFSTLEHQNDDSILYIIQFYKKKTIL